MAVVTRGGFESRREKWKGDTHDGVSMLQEVGDEGVSDSGDLASC